MLAMYSMYTSIGRFLRDEYPIDDIPARCDELIIRDVPKHYEELCRMGLRKRHLAMLLDMYIRMLRRNNHVR